MVVGVKDLGVPEKWGGAELAACGTDCRKYIRGETDALLLRFVEISGVYAKRKAKSVAYLGKSTNPSHVEHILGLSQSGAIPEVYSSGCCGSSRGCVATARVWRWTGVIAMA